MFTTPRRYLAVTLALATLLVTAALPLARADDSFPLKDGDTWVMIGDSITAQHLHSNYFEAYCHARFPQWTIHFRNAGVGGDTIPRALARFDFDAAIWKPTIVSVELGMNDSGAGLKGEPAYITEMGTLRDRIVAINARPVFFTSSPVNDGTTADKLADRNEVIDKYSASLSAFAAQRKAPFADQFHALLDRWGKNKAEADMTFSVSEVKKLANRPDTPHADLLKSWLDEWAKSHPYKYSFNLLGDGVHPGPPGQLTMSVALLHALHAPGLVSKATIDAEGKVMEAMQCRVADAKAENGGVSFTRLDQCLPMPIPDDARTAVDFMPEIAELSQWMLTVKGLKAGEYEIKIDGVSVGHSTADALDNGCNLGTLDKGPVADQGRKLLTLVAAKENFVSQFRAKSYAVAKEPADQIKAALEPFAKQVVDADANIRAAAQPQSHKFVVVPVK